jgi:hypothetical protein
MAKKKAVKKIEIPKEWDKLRDIDEVQIVMGEKEYRVSVDLAKALIKKGKAQAK